MANKKVKILIFEDEQALFEKLVHNLRLTKSAVDMIFFWSRDGDGLLDENGGPLGKVSDEYCLEGNVDLILVDLKMSTDSPYHPFGGIAILKKIFSLRNHCRSVVATTKWGKQIEANYPEIKLAIEELEQQEELIVIDRDSAKARDYTLLRQIIASRAGRFLRSPQIERQILFLGRTNDPVLILGPRGSGKEYIARAIHNAWCEHLKGGEKRPFESLNAGAFQYDLMRAELFGYAEKSFTGASSKGAVGAAFRALGITKWEDVRDQDILPPDAEHQGTLFLDEIANADIACQGVLLRFLGEPFAAAPFGHHEIHNVRPRIIAATNSPFWIQYARTGTVAEQLRPDLFDRVACHVIIVPGLVPDDVNGIIRLHAEQEWQPEAIESVAQMVEEGSIHGNIRGLINFVRRTELLVQQGGDIGWNFRAVDKKTVQLSARMAQPTDEPTKVSLASRSGTFVTPRGNSVTNIHLEQAFQYAETCEIEDKSTNRVALGSLLSEYSETTAELIVLTWFATYRKQNKPKHVKLEEFRHAAASKWFISMSESRAHTSVQKTAKNILGINSIRDINAWADKFRAWCESNGIWPSYLP